MPTRQERIGVVRDDALSAALESVRSIQGETTPLAARVRDLAIRGAEALRADERRRRELLTELAEWSTSDDPPWDREVLARVDELSAG